MTQGWRLWAWVVACWLRQELEHVTASFNVLTASIDHYTVADRYATLLGVKVTAPVLAQLVAVLFTSAVVQGSNLFLRKARLIEPVNSRF